MICKILCLVLFSEEDTLKHFYFTAPPSAKAESLLADSTLNDSPFG